MPHDFKEVDVEDKISTEEAACILMALTQDCKKKKQNKRKSKPHEQPAVIKKRKKRHPLAKEVREQQMLESEEEPPAQEDALFTQLMKQNEPVPTAGRWAYSSYELYTRAIELLLWDFKEISCVAASIGIAVEVKSDDSSPTINSNSVGLLTEKIAEQIKKIKNIKGSAEAQTLLNDIEQRSCKERIAAIEEECKRKADIFEKLKIEKAEQCGARKRPIYPKARDGNTIFGKMTIAGGRSSTSARAKKAVEMLESDWENLKKIAGECGIEVEEKDSRKEIFENIENYLARSIDAIKQWLPLSNLPVSLSSSHGTMFKISLFQQSTGAPMELDQIALNARR